MLFGVTAYNYYTLSNVAATELLLAAEIARILLEYYFSPVPEKIRPY